MLHCSEGEYRACHNRAESARIGRFAKSVERDWSKAIFGGLASALHVGKLDGGLRLSIRHSQRLRDTWMQPLDTEPLKATGQVFRRIINL